MFVIIQYYLMILLVKLVFVYNYLLSCVFNVCSVLCVLLGCRRRCLLQRHRAVVQSVTWIFIVAVSAAKKTDPPTFQSFSSNFVHI